jgi:hypothetical protein
MKRRFPIHGLVGVAILVIGEILLFRGNRFVETYFTPLVWTGYILLMDALVASLKGESPLTARRMEFLLLWPLSIIAWYVFEGVNLLLKNWTYINLPEGTAARWIGYAWSYGTILPGILLTAELIETLLGERLTGRRPADIGPGTVRIFFYTGFLLFVVTLLFPSRYFCPLPWISVLLWFEGMNDHLNVGSFSAMFRRGNYRFFVSLIISGAVCGFLWEFWNFWAGTKWNYHVPYLPEVRLFEMPVLGYLGFLSFALECYLMYRFLRYLVPVRRSVDVLGKGW